MKKKIKKIQNKNKSKIKKSKSKIHTISYKQNNFNQRFYQGYYKIQKPEKCINKTKYVEYKSLIEYRFLHQLEQRSNNIKKWGIETFIVPYYFNGKWRRYYMDFYIEKAKNDGSMDYILIELKDDKNIKFWNEYKKNGTLPKKGRKKISTYKYELNQFKMNVAKWEQTYKLIENKPNYHFYIWGKNDF